MRNTNKVSFYVWYGILAVCIAGMVLYCMSAILYSSLVREILQTQGSLLDKSMILISLPLSLFFTSTIFGTVLLCCICILSGIYGAIMVYTVRHHIHIQKGMWGGGIISFIVGTFGIGCSACGSLLLSAILSGAGAVGAISIASVTGIVLNIVSIAILLGSIVYLVRAIKRPKTCALDNHYE